MIHSAGRYLHSSINPLRSVITLKNFILADARCFIQLGETFSPHKVHHQSREQAARIKAVINTTKTRYISDVQKNVMSGWQKEKENLVDELEYEYAQCLSSVGQAHRNAAEQPRVLEVLAEHSKWNRHHAAQRGHVAGRKVKELQNEKEKKALGGIICRKKAIHAEKIRAKEVANLPTPEAFKPKKVSNPKSLPLVLKHEAGTFITSAYAPTGVLVEKEVMSTFPNAKLRAEREQKALEAKAEEQAREKELTKKKIDERGKIALQQEHTKNLYEELLRKLEKEKKDHNLSVYLQGADFNLLETESQRLKRLNKLQKDMEEKVEKVLEESESQSAFYDKTMSHSESADLKDISDTPDYTASDMISEVRDLQDQLRKIREYRESVIKSSDGSSSGISSSGIGNSRNISVGLDIISKKERKEKVTLPLIEDGRQEWFHERVGVEVSSATESSTTEMPCSSTSEDREEENLDQDIHLTETVAVDRLGDKIVDKQKLHTHQRTPLSSESTEVGECTPFEALVSPTGIFSVEEDYGSNEEGLELKILIDPGHGTPEQSFETHIGGVHFYGESRQATHMKKVYEKEHSKDKDTGHKSQELSSSTSYLSFPSRLYAKTMDDIGVNLRQIQSQRPKIQQMLDDLTSVVPLPSHSTPVMSQDVHPRLYSEELKEEGSGKRPMKKKHKFEFHRKQILKQYTKRLVSMKQKDVQQVSASTVDSSGLTIFSLGQLSSMAEKTSDENFDKSSSGSQPNLASESVSSSSVVPQCDTDEVPTNLNCIMNQNEENSHSAFTNEGILSQVPCDHFSKHLSGKESTPLAPGYSVTEEHPSSLSSVEPSGKGSSRSMDAGSVENLRKQWYLVEKILELQNIKKRLLQQQEAAIASEGSHSELDIQVPEKDIPSCSRIKGVHQSSLRERKVTFRGSIPIDSDQTESQPSINSDGIYQTLSHGLGSFGEEAKDSAYVEQWQQSKPVGGSSRSDSMKNSKSLQRENTTVTHRIPYSGLSRRLGSSKAHFDLSFDKLVPESIGESKSTERIKASSSTVPPQQPFVSRGSSEPKGSSVTPEFTLWSDTEGISKEKTAYDQEFTLPQDVSQSLTVSQEGSQRSGRSVADEGSSSASMPDMTAVLEKFGLTLS